MYKTTGKVCAEHQSSHHFVLRCDFNSLKVFRYLVRQGINPTLQVMLQSFLTSIFQHSNDDSLEIHSVYE